MLIAQVDDAAALPEALMLMGVGMLVVFASLMLLMLAIVLLNWLGAEASTGQAEAETSLAPSGKAGELDAQTLAVLAAAATVALQRPTRITGARRIEPGEQPSH